jgi:glutamate dehydrogenase
MYKKDGTPRFKYIVEGANLFISDGARFLKYFRQKIEDSGIILFKDASTNKGGVTSSSFEVQAALSMQD